MSGAADRKSVASDDRASGSFCSATHIVDTPYTPVHRPSMLRGASAPLGQRIRPASRAAVMAWTRFFASSLRIAVLR